MNVKGRLNALIIHHERTILYWSQVQMVRSICTWDKWSEPMRYTYRCTVQALDHKLKKSFQSRARILESKGMKY